MPGVSNRFQILSLDGGGIRGIFAAAILAAIESDLGVRITDHFDLISGTSTGGIIALGLGLGISPKEILDFYLEEGSKIFPCRFGLAGKLKQFLMRKYPARPLEEALRNCFGDRLLGHSKKRLVIPSYNLGEDDVYLFRTAHHERLIRDYKVPAWKIGRATSAAPTYFSCSRDVDSIRLIDGGVWANNPSTVALVEAYGTLQIPLEKTHLLSIGTLQSVKARRKRLNSGGIIGWGLGNAAVDLIMRGQSIGANNQVSFFLGKNKYLRVNPVVPAAEISLDKTSNSDDLIAKASHYSRGVMQSIKVRFMEHKAPMFNPLHSVENNHAN